ncbi:MAG: hypothetical protein HY270_20920 [Deltaproteobacteria bacterium]|nr:hypothetical protein [Deltaproteobacteria bacterium]
MHSLPVFAQFGRRWTLGLAVMIVTAAAPLQALPRGKRPPLPSTDQPAAFETNQRSAASHADAVNRPDPQCRPRDTLVYHGGALIKNPDVFLIFWGNEWQTDPEQIAARNALVSFYQAVGSSEYACAWQEYAVAGQPLGNGTYNGAEVITNEPALLLTDAAIQQKIVDEVMAGHAPPISDDRVYIVVPKRDVVVEASDGTTGCGGSKFVFCGYHDSFADPGNPSGYVRYAVLPYPCTTSNGSCFSEPDASGSLQSVGSHELTEAVTDPDNQPGGWYSDRSGNENADVCASAACEDTITVGMQTFPVNPAWSNLGRGCITGVSCSAPPLECTDGAPGICVGGTSQAKACQVEWLADPNLTLAAQGLPGRAIRCGDGQPFCDADGVANGECTFRLAVCLNNQDPRLTCSPMAVDRLALTSPLPTSSDAFNLANATTVLNALAGIDPMSTGTLSGSVVSFAPSAATADSCTGYLNIKVPLRPNGKSGRRRFALTALTAFGSAHNRLTLSCTPAP